MPRHNESGATLVFISYFLFSAFTTFWSIPPLRTTLVDFIVDPTICKISHRKRFQCAQVRTALSSVVHPSSKDKQEGTLMRMWISKQRLHLLITNAISEQQKTQLEHAMVFT